jgi:signal transduction histidine kinase/ActR/RegA family two-component response regulator
LTYSLAVVVGGTVFILSVIFIIYNRSSLEKDLELRLENLARLTVNGVSSALWQYNYEYIDDYLDSLLQYESVVFISVYTENKLIQEKAREDFGNKGADYFTSSAQFLTKQADILYQDAVIGKIYLSMSRERVNRMVARNGALAVLILFSSISGISVTMFILYRKYIFTPLTLLEGSARTISKGRLDTEIDTSGEDEIGNLARAFKQMIRELTTIMASRDELETEIAERKRVENLLRSREQLLNEMGSIAKIGGWEYDPIRQKTVCTKEIFRILEIDEGSSPSPNELFKYYPPGCREKLEKAYQQAEDAGKSFDLELQCTTAKGRLFWERTIGHPEFENNRCVRIKGTRQDITEIKRMEENLRHAYKMESIGTLAGGIAHDFNNMLSPIIGLAELLIQDMPPGSPEGEKAHLIFKAGQRGANLVRQILAFSRQTEHKMVPIRLQDILEEVLTLTRSTIPSNIEIHQKIQSDCGLIMADPTQMHQVALNIITNAYHAVETEGGQISVELRELVLGSSDMPDKNLEPGTYILLSIFDTGHGMSAEVMGKIFDPYFTSKDQGKGTGLGLAVVYGIIKRHKGDINVYSKPGRGSTFTIYLPVLDTPDEAKPISVSEERLIGNERILLVDDEEVIVSLVKQMLERAGYAVTSRLRSIEALEAFKANPDSFDLVISDMAMPSLTGDKLAEKILSIRPNIPIIICTGFSESMDEEKAKLLGIKGFIMKPIIYSELAKLVRKVLDEATA